MVELGCEYIWKPGHRECGKPATHRLLHQTWAYDLNYLLCKQHAKPVFHPPDLQLRIKPLADDKASEDGS